MDNNNKAEQTTPQLIDFPDFMQDGSFSPKEIIGEMRKFPDEISTAVDDLMDEFELQGQFRYEAIYHLMDMIDDSLVPSVRDNIKEHLEYLYHYMHCSPEEMEIIKDKIHKRGKNELEQLQDVITSLETLETNPLLPEVEDKLNYLKVKYEEIKSIIDHIGNANKWKIFYRPLAIIWQIMENQHKTNPQQYEFIRRFCILVKYSNFGDKSDHGADLSLLSDKEKKKHFKDRETAETKRIKQWHKRSKDFKYYI
jgi:hypothetical protein